MTPFPRLRGSAARMRNRQLRRDCESRLAALGAPASWDIDELCDLVAEQINRRICRVPVAMSAMHPCGFWVSTEHIDFIVYESETSRIHQEHIIAHELAHIICCHRGSTALTDESARLLFPDLDPDLVRDMLQRASYSDRQEQEAEMLASLIMERVTKRRPEPASTTAADTVADEVTRIARSLTYQVPRPRR
jgi:Zn-dependent peptidase ImmA (M78 family)